MEWVVRIGLKPGHDRLAHLLTCFFTLCTCCTRNLQGPAATSQSVNGAVAHHDEGSELAMETAPITALDDKG